MPRSGIAGSYGNSNFLRNLHCPSSVSAPYPGKNCSPSLSLFPTCQRRGLSLIYCIPLSLNVLGFSKTL